MKLTVHTVLFGLMFPFAVFSQLSEQEVRNMAARGDEQELVYESSNMIRDGYLYQAEILIDALLEKDPQRPNYNYRKGFVVLESRQDFETALPYLEKAVSNTDKNYDLYSAGERSASVDAYYYLAKCYHLNVELDKARTYYQRFIAESNKKSPLVDQAQLGLKQCDVAERLLANPKQNVSLKNIGSPVNSKYPDYSPVISLDGAALYFTSKRPWENEATETYRDPKLNQYPEDIYVSYKDFDGKWEAPVRLDMSLPDRNEATMAVSPDERRIYVYKDNVGYGDVYFSDFRTNRFREVEAFDVEGVNTQYWEPHAIVSADGQTLYFVSERPEGFGGRDIYRLIKLPDGNWSKPQNLGPTINTPYDEDAPFISVDNKTLYYASNGPESMGGFDIMVSVRDEERNWSTPINLGSPVNSTGDDVFYTTTIDGRTAYLTSFRKGGTGEKDIYEIQNDYLSSDRIAVLKGRIKTTDGSSLPEGLFVRLACANCGEDFQWETEPRPRDGGFISALEPCRDYEIVLLKKDGTEEFYRESLKTDCQKSFEELYREFLLDPQTMTIVPPKDTSTLVEAPPVEVRNYENIALHHEFGYNENKLNVRKGELKRFMKQLEKQVEDGRSKIVITIRSSASHVPTQTYNSNEELAGLRAENIKYDLMNYIDQHPKLKGFVVVVIAEASVNGPSYADDARQRDKYRPYQYIDLQTE